MVLEINLLNRKQIYSFFFIRSIYSKKLIGQEYKTRLPLNEKVLSECNVILNREKNLDTQITVFQILRFAQNDKTFLPFHFKATSYKFRAYFLMYRNKASR